MARSLNPHLHHKRAKVFITDCKDCIKWPVFKNVWTNMLEVQFDAHNYHTVIMHNCSKCLDGKNTGSKSPAWKTYTRNPVREYIPTGGCIHHWVIDSPNGVTSTGRCKKCNTEKQFKNWLEDIEFLTKIEIHSETGKIHGYAS